MSGPNIRQIADGDLQRLLYAAHMNGCYGVGAAVQRELSRRALLAAPAARAA